MVIISEEIKENLKPFADIINYSGTYEFDDRDSEKNGVIDRIPEWPDFNERNFEELVLWLDNVETFVRWENLTHDATLLLLIKFLEHKYNGFRLFTELNLHFHTMLDIKIYVIKKFFKRSVVFSVLSDLLNGPLNAETIEAILTEFSNKCRAFVMAVLSFEVPLCINKTVLMVSLLSRIPLKIKRKVFKHKGFPAEWNLSKLFDYILEKDENVRILKEEQELECATALVSSLGETEKTTSVERSTEFSCFCCGKTGHMKSRCPFRYSKCGQCNKIGHCVNMCRSNK